MKTGNRTVMINWTGEDLSAAVNASREPWQHAGWGRMLLAFVVGAVCGILLVGAVGCADTTFGRAPDGAIWYSGNRKMQISERSAEVDDGDFHIRARAKDDVSPEMVKMMSELRQMIESLKTAPALPALPMREPKPSEKAGSR